ncbi:MAG: HEAT repeat domain-containing protein [Planctomycetes bacterium]|nr:HEAT repeat domain-containing protein [Planctomycetota bacterium]
MLLELAAKDAAPEILGALQRARSSESAGSLFDIYMKLLESDAVPSLIALLEHRLGAIRTRAGNALLRSVSDRHFEEIRTLARSPRSESRTLSVPLLLQSAGERALPELLVLLGDASTATATAAASAVATLPQSATIPHLRDRILKGKADRLLGYDCLALALSDERNPVEGLDDLVAKLLEAVNSREPFVSASAAALLAAIGFRTEATEASSYLESQVVPALVVAAGGQSFFADFSAVHAIAIRKLTLLSDRTFGSDGPAWVRWWKESATTFRANRATFAIDASNISELSIDLARTDRIFTLRMKGGTPGPGVAEGDDFILEPAEIKALCAAHLRPHLFPATTPPGIRQATVQKSNAADSRPWAILTFRTKGQRKLVGMHEGAQWPQFQQAVAACEALVASNRWQRYRNPATTPDREADLSAEREFLSREQDEQARAGRLLKRILEALPLLPSSRLPEAWSDLASIPDLRARMTESQYSQLLPFLAVGERATEGAAQLVPILSTSSNRAIFEKTASALGNLRRAEARPLLDLAMVSFGKEHALAALDHPRAPVRAAATAYLAKTAGSGAAAALLERLQDSSEEVQLEAAVALGERREAAAVRLLAEIESDLRTSAGLRRVALSSLGRIGGPDALPTIWRATADSDLAIRKAAYGALAGQPDPATGTLVATAWLRALALGDVKAEEIAVIRDALVTSPTETAREALRRTVATARPATRRDIALALADLGCADAVPLLAEELKSGSEASIRAALTALTCVDLFDGSDPAVMYRGWFEKHKNESAAEWFLSACRERNLGQGLSADRLDLPPQKEAIEGLCDVLVRADDWFLRVRAYKLLRFSTPTFFGEVDRFTGPEERKRIAALYAQRTGR